MANYQKTGAAFALMGALFYCTQGIAYPMNASLSKPVMMTLKDAVLLSLRNNPTVKQDEIQRISDKFKMVVARNQFEPQYTLTASQKYTNTVASGVPSWSRSYGISPSVKLENHYGTEFTLAMTNPITGSNGSSDTYNPSLTFTVMQPLIQGFGKPVVDATLNNAKDSELINRLNFRQSISKTIGTVVSDYLSLVEAFQTLKVDQTSLQNYQETVDNDKAMIAAGQMARSDIVQAQAQVAQQKATIITDKNAIDTARNTLLNDLGLPPRTNIVVPKHFSFKQAEKEITGNSSFPNMLMSEKIALARNIGFQTSIITLRTLRRSLLVAKDNRRWKLNLTASEEVGGGSGDTSGNSGIASLHNGQNHEESVGLDLTVPIDDVSSQQGVIDQQVAIEKAIIGLRQAKRELIEGTDTDYRTVQSNKKNLELSKKALELQQRTVEISREKHQAGRLSTFQMLSDQKDLNTEEQSVVTSEVGYLNSIVSYEQELSTLLEAWHIKLKY